MLLARRLIRRSLPIAITLPTLAATWLGALSLYFFAGQPGFYGDEFFVILRDQADVSPAYQIADRNERLQFVYEALTRHAFRTQSDIRSLLDVPRLRPLPNSPSAGTGGDSAPAEPQWNVTAIGVDRVWRELGITGEGIVVGQSDTGIEGEHPALRASYRGRSGHDDYNWLDPWNGTTSPTDVIGHGTYTLGTIVGQENIGLAPGAEWFACVNLARNLGNAPRYLDCMQFILAPYPHGGDPLADGDPASAAHVSNNSWGCPPIEGCDANALLPAVRALRAAGIFVVAAAGNEGPDCGSVSDPIAIYDEVFAVGALDEFGEVAGFSSRGPVTVDGSERIKPDILAPGDGVLSAWPGSSYTVSSGTSTAGRPATNW